MKSGASVLVDIGNIRLKALPLAAFADDSWPAPLRQSDLDGKPFHQALDEVRLRTADGGERPTLRLKRS